MSLRRKPKPNREPAPGKMFARVRPLHGCMFYEDGEAGRKTVIGDPGDWVEVTLAQFAKMRKTLLSEPDAADADERDRRESKATKGRRLATQVAWYSRQLRATERQRADVYRLAGERHAETDPARRAMLDEGIEMSRQAWLAAVAAFESKNPRPVDRRCEGCGQMFLPEHGKDLFCSPKCATGFVSVAMSRVGSSESTDAWRNTRCPAPGAGGPSSARCSPQSRPTIGRWRLG